jgi:hypothetical protein
LSPTLHLVIGQHPHQVVFRYLDRLIDPLRAGHGLPLLEVFGLSTQPLTLLRLLSELSGPDLRKAARCSRNQPRIFPQIQNSPEENLLNSESEGNIFTKLVG